METLFEVGDVVHLKSDIAKKCAMTVFKIKNVRPEPYFNPLTGEFETPDFQPYTQIFTTWLNSQHAVIEKSFPPQILQKFSQ